MIIGAPGSGKSTLAREVGARLGLPVVHIDTIHWQPGWVQRPREERLPLAAEVEAREAWVFEGGFSETWPNRAARAELVIWLDLPLGLRLWRVFKRRVRWHGQTRPDLPENCPRAAGPGVHVVYPAHCPFGAGKHGAPCCRSVVGQGCASAQPGTGAGLGGGAGRLTAGAALRIPGRQGEYHDGADRQCDPSWHGPG